MTDTISHVLPPHSALFNQPKPLETYLVLYNQADELREKTGFPSKQAARNFSGKCQISFSKSYNWLFSLNFSEFRETKSNGPFGEMCQRHTYESRVRTLVF